MASLAAADLFNVKGQVIVITGGGTGLGAMMTKTLAQNGAHRIYILGRRLEKLEEVAKQHGVNGNVVPIQCDVSSTDQLAAAAKKVKDEIGYVNVVVANSGISGPQVPKEVQEGTIEQLQEYIWKQGMQAYTDTYNLNITGVLFTLTAFLLLLDAGNKDGKSAGPSTGIKSQFIVTSSIAGYNRTPTAGFAYGSSKAGVNLLMKQMTLALARFSIRVNALCPGLYPSEMSEPLLAGTGFSTEVGSIPPERIPVTRLGNEQDMGGNILFLCSRAGAYLDGNFLITDGGRLASMPATY